MNYIDLKTWTLRT